MRRWLSVLLLVLLPLQFSWAVSATYCEHETGGRAVHFGHHEHQHQPASAEAAEPGKGTLSGALDVADCHFHCQCAAAVPAATGVPVVKGVSQATHSTVADVLAPMPPRPERPQWADHA